MMYALGRELEYFDMPEVRGIVRAAAAQDYRFSSLVKGIVESDAFRTQAAPSDEESESVRVSLESAARRPIDGE